MPGTTGFSFLGIAKETTKGTPAAATHYIPATSFDGDDATDVLMDNGMRASMATTYGSVKGVTTANFSVEGDVFLDTIGFLLAGIMGDTDTTGASDPFTHVFSLRNDGDGQCQPFTITDYQGLQARQYAAATQSSLSLRLAAQELFTYSAAFVTNASVTTSTPTPSFGTLAPMAGWTGSVSVAGSPNVLVEEMDINLSRNVSPVHTVDGASNPLQIWQGPLAVNGRIMFLADDETEFQRYLNVSQPSLEIELAQSSHSLTIVMSKVTYTSAKVERGDDFTQVSAQFEAIANTTDAGSSGGFAPIKLTLVNAIAAGVYD